ncbi:MAG TPA: class I SAM-dependent methyltransferase [Bryobacteraceae bacterium]|nr:class I SAM-dependent methyltransferase [Bryobacteraceae bacterium]
MSSATAYDEFAWFYDRYWARPFQEWQSPILDRLLLSALPRGATILDLCCGTGHLAASLIAKGFRVTGVDSSPGMLARAAVNAPEARFIHASAAKFSLSSRAQAAVCTFDSVNHILSLPEIVQSFRNVHAALEPPCLFLCDVNTREAYGENWDKTWSAVESDHACFLRGAFDPQTMIGTTRITMFRLHGEQWRRSDVEVRQRCYSVEEIRGALTEAGFVDVKAWRPSEDAGLNGHFGTGRVYLLACANSAS